MGMHVNSALPDPAQIKELDRVIKIHEEIIRHIIVKQDD